MSGRLLDKFPKMMEDPAFAATWEEFSRARAIIRTRAAAGASQNKPVEKNRPKFIHNRPSAIQRASAFRVHIEARRRGCAGKTTD